MKKPDFKKLAENEYTREYDYLEREAFVKGCELVWKMLEDEVAYYKDICNQIEGDAAKEIDKYRRQNRQ